MDEQARHRLEQPDGAPAPPSARAYEAPTVVRHGHIAVVAGGKEVGASDGISFLGVDIGDVFS